MQETFFTSKQASEITGCTLRQLQYWREKGVIVPTISATGTGRSVYYSRSDLLALATMEYCLSVGLSFEAAASVLQMLKQKAPNFTDPAIQKRFMLLWDGEKKDLRLEEFERENAIAFLDRCQPVIPLCLQKIREQLNKTLGSKKQSK